MRAVSNNFSLARMVDPIWPGCVSASEPAFNAWLRDNQMPLFAWSSQARGFFTGRAGPDKRSDAELVRCWYSDDNFERSSRAIQLAAELQVDPINIALAYVLSLPFPTFALIGPRNCAELHSTWKAIGIALSPEHLAWLAATD
jgi:aryl-alcohol dehydrogenase-like predicted oxidoreductase